MTAPRLKKRYGLECEVKAVKSCFGKVLNYTARLGDFETSGPTPEVAAAELRSLIEQVSRDRGLFYTAQWRGYLFVTRYDSRFAQWSVCRVELAAAGSDSLLAGWHATSYAIGTDCSKPPTPRLVGEMVLQDLIKYCWRPADGFKVPCTVEPATAQELAKWIEFQLRWQDATQRGLSEQACHDYAGRNPAARELWAHEPREELTLIQG